MHTVGSGMSVRALPRVSVDPVMMVLSGCRPCDFESGFRCLKFKLVANQAGIVGICDSEHIRGEKHYLPLKDIPGVLGVNCRGRDESEEESLYCILMGWMALDLNGWRCCLFEVSNTIYISPYADEGSVYFSVCLEDVIELIGKSEALDKCRWEYKPSTWDWQHFIKWIDYGLVVWMCR